MKVKNKEKLNNPLKGWQILSAISSMVFHTVHCDKDFTEFDFFKHTKQSTQNQKKLLAPGVANLSLSLGT